jgi:hypothetical protein
MTLIKGKAKINLFRRQIVIKNSLLSIFNVDSSKEFLILVKIRNLFKIISPLTKKKKTKNCCKFKDDHCGFSLIKKIKSIKKKTIL